jgi:TolA-binding protein
MKSHLKFRYLIPLICALAGCDPNASRPEYMGNGQGGVQIRPVPYDAPAPQPVAPTAAIQTRTDSLENQIRQQQAQIESLENIIRRQEDEIRQLKGQPPATMPAVH